MSTETILCVEASILKGIADRGFLPATMRDLKDILKPDFALFAPRERIENRVEFRQIIPYVILRNENSVAMYERTSQSAEQRLHRLSSIGFGGHVEIKDIVLDKDDLLHVERTVEKAAIREMREEIKYSAVISKETIGFILDDRDLVNRVHLGIVDIWDLETAFVRPIENTISECRFMHICEIPLDETKIERWSYLCLAFLQETCP
jgi:predicted NUDIX family phosphoesterase